MKNFVMISLMVFSFQSVKAANLGDVTMKINPALVQVSLGEREVSVGDRVAIFKKTCTGGGKTPLCKKERVGGGSVARVLNEHYSEIKLDSGVHASEGYVVERE